MLSMSLFVKLNCKKGKTKSSEKCYNIPKHDITKQCKDEVASASFNFLLDL